MEINKKQYQQLLNQSMQLNDTFRFRCQMCGKCCRNRQEPIAITGYDLYRIAQKLNITPPEAAEKYTNIMEERNTKLPTLLLKERYDGSCRLLKNGKCSVQDKKPAVCALYPLGRFYDFTSYKFFYISQTSPCAGNDGQEYTLAEWLQVFDIPYQDYNAMYPPHLMIALTKAFQNTNPQLLKLLWCPLIEFMYLNYDTSKPYAEEFMKNVAKFKELFNSLKEEKLIPPKSKFQFQPPDIKLDDKWNTKDDGNE